MRWVHFSERVICDISVFAGDGAAAGSGEWNWWIAGQNATSKRFHELSSIWFGLFIYRKENWEWLNWIGWEPIVKMDEWFIGAHKWLWRANDFWHETDIQSTNVTFENDSYHFLSHIEFVFVFYLNRCDAHDECLDHVYDAGTSNGESLAIDLLNRFCFSYSFSLPLPFLYGFFLNFG